MCVLHTAILTVSSSIAMAFQLCCSNFVLNCSAAALHSVVQFWGIYELPLWLFDCIAVVNVYTNASDADSRVTFIQEQVLVLDQTSEFLSIPFLRWQRWSLKLYSLSWAHKREVTFTCQKHGRNTLSVYVCQPLCFLMDMSKDSSCTTSAADGWRAGV